MSAQQQQRLRWKLIPHGAQWAVTEEGTGFVILTCNTKQDAEKEGRALAGRNGTELILPPEEN